MVGFTKIENNILERIITSDFTKRQLKILFMIVRFSFGCQKNYAVLKLNDFFYAKVSRFCIKNELKKLIGKGVIKWNPQKETIWINKNLNEWAVDNSEENSEKFIKIASKNLPKQQLRVYQNSNFRVAKIATFSNRKSNQIKLKTGDIRLPKENNKEILNKKKENVFLNILKDYFLKISPLREDGIFVLRELFEGYNQRMFEKAISILSQGNDKSFSYFLKVLDGLAEEEKSFRQGGLESLKSGLKRFLISTPKL